MVSHARRETGEKGKRSMRRRRRDIRCQEVDDVCHHPSEGDSKWVNYEANIVLRKDILIYRKKREELLTDSY